MAPEPMDIDRVLGGFREKDTDAMEVVSDDEVQTSPILESIGGLRISKGGKRGTFSSAVRRAMNMRKKQAQQASPRESGKVAAKTKHTPRRGRYAAEKLEESNPFDMRGSASKYSEAYDESDYVHEPNGSYNPMKYQQVAFVLAGYLQLFFNVVVVGVILYFLLSFANSVRGDIRLKINEEIGAIKSEIARCRFHYMENRCHEAERVVPRMREQCAEWESCAERDPAAAAYQTRLTAELMAEVVNSFIDPISYKTMIFTVGITLAFTLLSNLAFFMARAKSLTATGRLAPDEEPVATTPVRTPQHRNSATRERYLGTPYSAYGQTPRRLEF